MLLRRRDEAVHPAGGRATRAVPLRAAGALAVAGLAIGGVAQAQLATQPAGPIEHQLADCARITASTERLACYDALSSTRRSFTDSGWNRAFGADASRTSPVGSEPKALEPGTAADFGFASRDSSGSTQQVQSRYDGEFTGWSGNTLFRLENGQVWKQSQSGRVDFRATRPVVTIRRSTLGAYRLNVQGLDQSIRVERVK
jgi:hypothetical protein